MGTGDYEAIAALIGDVHDQLVARLAPRAGERWLDIATGTGGVAERAACAGAIVTGIDLAPALVDVAKRRARDEGYTIDYRVGDCEPLDVEDGSFDVVSMFRMMGEFQPGPAPSNPLDWGREDYVRELIGDAFALEFERHVSTHHASSSEEYWQLFTTSFGPAKTLADSLGDRREDFHRAWIEFFDENFGASGGIAHEREYLLVTGTRR